MQETPGQYVLTFEPEHPVDAPPVLLVHSFGSSAEADWIAPGTVAALTGAGHRVVVPALPGHGSRPAPPTAAAATADALAAELLASLDALGIDEFDVVAYSLGARLTWALAELAGKRVQRAVLGGLSPFEPFEAVDVAALHRAVTDGVAPDDPFTGMIAGMLAAHGPAAAGLARCVEGLRSTPFRPTAWAGPQPPVLVAGAEDQMVRGLEGIVETLGARKLVTVGGDHQSALAGEEFRHTVLKALAR